MTCKSNKKERPMLKIKIYDITIDMLVDTGATVNVIDLNVYITFKKKNLNSVQVIFLYMATIS